MGETITRRVWQNGATPSSALQIFFITVEDLVLNKFSFCTETLDKPVQELGILRKLFLRPLFSFHFGSQIGFCTKWC